MRRDGIQDHLLGRIGQHRQRLAKLLERSELSWRQGHVVFDHDHQDDGRAERIEPGLGQCRGLGMLASGQMR